MTGWDRFRFMIMMDLLKTDTWTNIADIRMRIIALVWPSLLPNTHRKISRALLEKFPDSTSSGFSFLRYYWKLFNSVQIISHSTLTPRGRKEQRRSQGCKSLQLFRRLHWIQDSDRGEQIGRSQRCSRRSLPRQAQTAWRCGSPRWWYRPGRSRFLCRRWCPHQTGRRRRRRGWSQRWPSSSEHWEDTRPDGTKINQKLRNV